VGEDIGQDLFSPVRLFEKKLADFTGFKHAITVESCTAALFLCFIYRKVGGCYTIPACTYPSVPMQLVHAGGKPVFVNTEWQECGFYGIGNSHIYDSAIYIGRSMRRHFLYYRDLVCLSFHHKKQLPIGRGGAILTDDDDCVAWFKSARHDGRHDGCDLGEDPIDILGWNMLLTPEQASRGIALMGNLKDENKCPYQKYPDVRNYPIWNG
jgi:dTDP-4-amino-4,6-dideoxygalactose transaminase